MLQSNFLIIYLALFTFALLCFDFIIDSKIQKKVTNLKGALMMTGMYFAVVCLMFVLILIYYGLENAKIFATGYLLEYSLSLDNIFIFILIIKTFNIGKDSMKKIISYGIAITMLLRMGLILFGVKIIEKFEFIMIFFGIILILFGIKSLYSIFVKPNIQTHFQRESIVNFLSKFFNISADTETTKFLLQNQGKIFITNNLMALFAISIADIICAIDSIPAILSITNNISLIYLSNLFAIIGLRSVYVFLTYLQERSKHLDICLSIILLFIGSKIIINLLYPDFITITDSLIVIVVIFALYIIMSIKKYLIKS